MTRNNYGHPTPLDHELAAIVSEETAKAGIRIGDLADHLGWLYVTLNDRLRGLRPLHTRDLVDIAAAIGVDPAKLLRAAVKERPSELTAVPKAKRRRCQVCGKAIRGDAHSRQIYCPGECTDAGRSAKVAEWQARNRHRRRNG